MKGIMYMGERRIVQQIATQEKVFIQLLGYEKIISGINNDWVVFIHGMGGNRNAFKKQIDDYKKKYNLLLIDLHGHGLSKELALWKAEKNGEEVSFESIACSILKVLDNEGIEKAHFVGLSLGTLALRVLAELAPERICSMVLAGAVVKWGVKMKSLFIIGNMTKTVAPYMLLYAIFAWIMMPRRNHKKSRKIFIQEAKNLGGPEFFQWFKLIQSFDKKYPPEKLNNISISISTLYMMGSQDHMFTGHVLKYVPSVENSTIHIVEKCGHCSCIERADEYNLVSLNFLRLLGNEAIIA